MNETITPRTLRRVRTKTALQIPASTTLPELQILNPHKRKYSCVNCGSVNDRSPFCLFCFHGENVRAEPQQGRIVEPVRSIGSALPKTDVYIGDRDTPASSFDTPRFSVESEASTLPPTTPRGDVIGSDSDVFIASTDSLVIPPVPPLKRPLPPVGEETILPNVCLDDANSWEIVEREPKRSTGAAITPLGDSNRPSRDGDFQRTPALLPKATPVLRRRPRLPQFIKEKSQRSGADPHVDATSPLPDAVLPSTPPPAETPIIHYKLRARPRGPSSTRSASIDLPPPPSPSPSTMRIPMADSPIGRVPLVPLPFALPQLLGREGSHSPDTEEDDFDLPRFVQPANPSALAGRFGTMPNLSRGQGVSVTSSPVVGSQKRRIFSHGTLGGSMSGEVELRLKLAERTTYGFHEVTGRKLPRSGEVFNQMDKDGGGYEEPSTKRSFFQRMRDFGKRIVSD